MCAKAKFLASLSAVDQALSSSAVNSGGYISGRWEVSHLLVSTGNPIYIPLVSSGS